MDRLPYFFLLCWHYRFFFNFGTTARRGTLAFKGIGSVLALLLFSVNLSGEFYQHPKLIELRAECDSLDCPKKYATTYRLLAEDLFLPLHERMRYLDIAEIISLNIADQHNLLDIYAQRGRINFDKGRYTEALKAFNEGMSYVGSRDDKEWLREEGWFLTGYGMLLYRVRLYEDAMDIFRQCANVMSRNKDDYGEAVALNNVALCHNRLGRYDSAEANFLRAYEIRKTLDQEFLICHSLLYLARVNRLMNRYEKADSILQEAVSTSEKANDLEFIGDIYCEWAEIALNDQQYFQAKAHLERAKAMEFPFRDVRWINLKIELFEAIDSKDSLHFYLDTALAAVRDFENLDLQVGYLIKKEKLLRSEGKTREANLFLAEINHVNQKLIALKDTLQLEMMLVQGDYLENREMLSRLEASNNRQGEIIAYQNRTILFVTLIALILLTAFIVYYRFIQRLKSLSQRLRLMYQRTRLAADQMNTVIMAMDYSERLIFFNSAAKRHFKFFDGAELRENEKLLNQLKTESIKADWKSHLNQVGQKSSYQVISSRKQNGRTYYHLVSLSEMHSKGKLEGTVAVLTDVTANQEKSLELSRKTMALEQANDAKQKVLSLLAHDLKEGVVSSLELARLSLQQEDNDPEDRKLHLQMIFDSLGRTKALLFKTLDWLKHQASGMQIQKKPLFIARLVEDLIKEKQIEIKQKEIQVINSMDQSLQVMADPNALRVILRNLLANAIKFVAPKSGKVRLVARSVSAIEVEVSIQDNGRGLSTQQIATLMEGEKLPSTQGTLGEKGTGMGLNLCQDLLFNMGSTLQIQSSPEKGANFHFKLEIKSAAPEQ